MLFKSRIMTSIKFYINNQMQKINKYKQRGPSLNNKNRINTTDFKNKNNKSAKKKMIKFLNRENKFKL